MLVYRKCALHVLQVVAVLIPFSGVFIKLGTFALSIV